MPSARPLVVAAQLLCCVCWSCGGPRADLAQLLDPTWRVLSGTHGGIVDVWIVIRLFAREQQIDQADHSVRDGDDGIFCAVS